MYCFMTSVECQFLELPDVLERSIMGLMAVLKSPAIMGFVELYIKEKKLQKKNGSLLLGP